MRTGCSELSTLFSPCANRHRFYARERRKNTKNYALWKNDKICFKMIAYWRNHLVHTPTPPPWVWKCLIVHSEICHSFQNNAEIQTFRLVNEPLFTKKELLAHEERYTRRVGIYRSMNLWVRWAFDVTKLSDQVLSMFWSLPKERLRLACSQRIIIEHSL